LLKNKEDIKQCIQDDPWMMEILQTVAKLELPYCWICAGFILSKNLDTLHGFKERTPLPDIDVVYYDVTNSSQVIEKQYEEVLSDQMPQIPWSVQNQARMHIRNNVDPYLSTFDGIAKFPETATALGVKLAEDNRVLLVAPHGVEDVVHMQIKPTPYFEKSPERMKVFQERINEKN